MKKYPFALLSLLIAVCLLCSGGVAAQPVQTVQPQLLPQESLLPQSLSLYQNDSIVPYSNLPLPKSEAEPATAPPSTAEEFTQAVQARSDTLLAYGTTSVQYAVMDGSDIVASGTSGVYSMTENLPLTTSNLYGIGSISKVYTAAAAMKLVEEGKLDLDTPITAYLPEFKMQDERYTDITPRMLLNHSSGLYGSTLRNALLFDDNDAFSHDNFLEALSSQRLKADPGEFSVYCNDGFTLMELIVERVSGKGFTQYLNDTFFTPMAFHSTKTPQSDFDRSLLAKAYYPGTLQALPTDTLNTIGAGGIYSNAEELCWFAQVLSGNRPELLAKESAEAMMQPEYQNGIWPDGEDNSVGYGLGWDSVDLYPFNEYGIQALTKGGDTRLYHSALVVLPEFGMSAAVVSSGGSSGFNTAAASSMLLDLLVLQGDVDELLADKSFGVPTAAPMPASYQEFSGVYHAGSQYLNIEISSDGLLSLTYPDAPDFPAQTLTYVQDGGFVDETGTAKLDFAVESNGKTYLSQHTYSTLPGLGQMAMLQYVAEKLHPNSASQDAIAAWEARAGKKYYVVSEKYTSQVYAEALPATSLAYSDCAPGYISGIAITGTNDAQNTVQIPVTAGRDTADLHAFVGEDGIEYLAIRDGLYMREEGLAFLHGGNSSICTIQPTGYTRWFQLADELAGRILKVSVPEHGAYAVYDANGQRVYHSLVDGDKAVTLPQGGIIAFIGDVGARFEITLITPAG